MRDLKRRESPAALSYEAASTASHVARWWEPEPAARFIATFARATAISVPDRPASASSAPTRAASYTASATPIPPRCRSTPSKRSRSIIFSQAPSFFDGHRGLQHGLLLLPELGHLQVQLRSGPFDLYAARGGVQLAIEYGCPSIAFTYNEPTIWGEYVIDICQAAKAYGIKTVMVSNGYITREAFHDIYDHVDAANIDLKAFTENFYGRTTLTHLQPVLDTLKWLKNETNVWFEITNLMIPTLNDAPAETRALAEWILDNLGPDVPLHFTAFHPDFKLRDKPRTPPETLHAARAIALEVGLHYVYEGNIRSDAANTTCPSCKSLLIRRSWHDVQENRLAFRELSAEHGKLQSAGSQLDTGRVPHESPTEHAHWNDAHAESQQLPPVGRVPFAIKPFTGSGRWIR